ncbi:GMC family oxidoreductase [Kocuria tytonis]|uniref:Glucose-methanol-choline oxidoreductase N-terminal domain-containing protein n=1 Tax=Kocuria tytonis TaxID=2054280 RepID=A0A495A691_9MICC|nr:GMC family oxidoreductase N-terminal domain-containing protein [Kocuria tytonis]RKQ35289.1 hypothetical protein C1C97_008640 [Kocuria tytonis]
MTSMQQDTRHIIVVGAGTAGSIMAGRMAEAGHRVTLIEAGGQDTNPAIPHLSRLGELWHSPEDWDYFTVPQQHASGRVIHWPRGRVLGGSHALNAAIWVHGNPLDYDDWAAAGCDGWAWSGVAPVFEALEAYDGPAQDDDAAAPRGADGLVPVVGGYRRSPIFDAIIAAADAVGVPFNTDYNSGSQEGISQEQLTVRDGKRVTTYMAYAKPWVDRGAIEVRTGAVVERLVVADGRVTGVQLHAGGNAEVEGVSADEPTARLGSDGEVIEADEVVLCAGALDSPKILMRSGIGPAEYDPAIFSDPRDREALRVSLRQGREVVAAAPLAEGWGAREVHPGPSVSTEAEEDAYIDRTVTTYHHQVGTCRMGTDELAVVDPATLAVRGLEGVRVVDASVMPFITNGNTNAPSAMIGEKGARFLLGE